MDPFTDRLALVKQNADIAAQTLQNALKAFGHDVSVEVAPHSLTVWCQTQWLGRATYEEIACDGVVPAAARLIRSWATGMIDPQ